MGADDTFSHRQPILDGEISIEVVHDRVHLQYRARGHRVPVTMPLSAEAAERFFARGAEIAQYVRSKPVRPF